MPEQTKPYSGRLAFDPDSGFHIDPDGQRVVTDDEGKTWRYATKGDTSHNTRYHRRFATVDSTANRLMELTLEHGHARAAELVDAHHFDVQPDDAHFDGIKHDPDDVAETITSHTEAWS